MGALRVESAAAVVVVALALDTNPPSVVAGMSSGRAGGVTHAGLGTPPNRGITDEAGSAVLIDAAFYAAMKCRVTSRHATGKAMAVEHTLEAKPTLKITVQRGQRAVCVLSAWSGAAVGRRARLSRRAAYPRGARAASGGGARCRSPTRRSRVRALRDIELEALVATQRPQHPQTAEAFHGSARMRVASDLPKPPGYSCR